MHSTPRWDDIELLLACLENGSLSAAAVQLGVQQSTVSRRLSSLEEGLGGPLFTRTAEGVIPTALAEELRGHAEAMREHHEAVVRRAAGHEPAPAGTVRVACIAPLAVFGLLPAMERLADTHPDIRLDLVVSDSMSDLVRGEADVALRFARPTTGDLVGTRIAEFPLQVLASNAYLAAHGPPTLDSGRWVTVGLPFVQTPEEQWFDDHVTAAPWLKTNSYLTAATAIVDGLAVGLTTSMMRKLHDNLVSVDIGIAPPPPLEMWLITHRAMRHVPRVDAVWGWLLDEFREI